MTHSAGRGSSTLSNGGSRNVQSTIGKASDGTADCSVTLGQNPAVPILIGFEALSAK